MVLILKINVSGVNPSESLVNAAACRFRLP
jgi:hypothetical protein